MQLREHKIIFFNDTATTEIYTLSLHDALPIFPARWGSICPAPASFGGFDVVKRAGEQGPALARARGVGRACGDRKSTRLNSSHANISYAVFCLQKKKKHYHTSH